MPRIPLHLRRKYESETSRYVTVDGTRVHLCIRGSGPPLVLLHGVMASMHTWDGWVAELQEHYQLIRVDVPGFGLTGPMASDDYTPAYSAWFFDQLRQKLGIERGHIAGNSLGGFLAWYYAAEYPQHVDRLVLIDPIAYPQRLPPVMKLLTTPLVGDVARFITPRIIVERNVRQVYGDPAAVKRETIQRYHELLDHFGNRTGMVRTIRALKKHASDVTLARRIRKIAAPTLLMWGAKDRWVPVELLREWKRDLPHAEVKIYEHAGHIPMEEFPVTTARDAHAFLSRAAATDALDSVGAAE